MVSRVRRVLWSATALAVVGGLVYLLLIGRGLTYAFDEWKFVAQRNSWSVDSVLSAHNGHISVLPALIYVTVFRTIGLDHPEVFRVLALAVHAGCALCVAVLVGRRHGREIAALAGILVLFLGKGAQNILWGFQIGFGMSLLLFLVSMLLYERWEKEPTPGLLVWISLALSLSLLSSSVGVAAAVSFLAFSAISPHRRRLWWVTLPALVVFLLWRWGYSESLTLYLEPGRIARWMWMSLSASLGAFLDQSTGVGHLLAAGLIVLLVLQLRSVKTSPTQIAWISFLSIFWVMTGATRIYSPADPSRYLHLTMITLVVVFSTLVPRRIASHRWFTIGTAVVVCASIGLQFSYFRDHNVEMRDFQFAGPHMRGRLSVVELFPTEMDGSVALVSFLAAPIITIDEYLRAVRSTGSSPAYPPSKLTNAPLSVRRGADAQINDVGVLSVELTESDGCTVESAVQVISLAGGESVRLRSAAPNGIIVRRFAPTERSTITWREIPGGNVRVSVPRDELAAPWIVEFSTPVEPMRCPPS